MRHTVSSLGTADEEPPPDPPALDPLDPELHPVMAIAAAAQAAAAAIILCRTAGVLLARLWIARRGETNRKLSYKLALNARPLPD
jgi:hypothetical protein